MMKSHIRQLSDWLSGRLMIVSLTIQHRVVTSIRGSVRCFMVKLMPASLISSHRDFFTKTQFCELV